MKSNFRILRVTLFVFGWLAVSILGAVQPRKGAASEKFFYDPSLFVPEQTVPLAEIDGATLAALDGQVRGLGLAPGTAFYDARAGRWSSLILSRPLIPGSGAGNALTWSDGLAPRGVEDWKNAAWNALLDYLRANARDLKLDLAQLSTSPRISVHGDGDLIFIHVPRVVDGIPVRDNSIGAAINHGNLILLGLQRWGDVGANVPRSPGVSAQAAEDTVRAHVQPMAVAAFVKPPRLELVPVAAGAGIGYRLAWVVVLHDRRRPRQLGGSRRRVHGHAALVPGPQSVRRRHVTGGAYPVSNDQRPPDGIEQSDWPMPFADFTVDGVTRFTDSGGIIGCIPGSISSSRCQRHLRPRSRTSAARSTRRAPPATRSRLQGRRRAATDCTVPVGHSAGDTKSSRTGFYELNRITEQARGYLGAGTGGGDWARAQLTANMNMHERVQRVLGRLRGQLLQVPDRRLPQHRRASRRSSTTSGATAWTTTAQPEHRRPRRGDRRHLRRHPPQHVVHRARLPARTRSAAATATSATARRPPAARASATSTIVNHRCDAPHTISWITSGFTDGQCTGHGLGAPACPAERLRGPCNRETHCEGLRRGGDGVGPHDPWTC